jgi:hypothetical protein
MEKNKEKEKVDEPLHISIDISAILENFAQITDSLLSQYKAVAEEQIELNKKLLSEIQKCHNLLTEMTLLKWLKIQSEAEKIDHSNEAQLLPPSMMKQLKNSPKVSMDDVNGNLKFSSHHELREFVIKYAIEKQTK